MERKRNRPERYDRTVVENTLKAMKKIEEVRVKRQAKFWETRYAAHPRLHVLEHTNALVLCFFFFFSSLFVQVQQLVFICFSFSVFLELN